MIHLKQCTLLCFASLLTLSLAGCYSGVTRESPSPAPVSSASPIVPVVSWETKEYEDSYLKYKLPSTWEQNPDYSDEDMRLSFFTASEATSDSLSNVNIQIMTLKNQGKNMDYGNPTIQEEFHQFLLSEAGLPQEADNGVFEVFQAPSFYVYTLRFSRATDAGTVVEQTAFIPVGLDYTIIIWATDWKDGASPSAAEVARHLCETLEIKEHAAN